MRKKNFPAEKKTEFLEKKIITIGRNQVVPEKNNFAIKGSKRGKKAVTPDATRVNYIFIDFQLNLKINGDNIFFFILITLL